MTHAPTFAFGPFLYIPRRQLLLKDGQPVRVGCRALDLLTAFVRCPGEVLTKSQLLAQAWPDTTVVEGNLKVHVAALRRTLDDDGDSPRYIATVNGRGYRFVAPVETGICAAPSPVVARRSSMREMIQSRSHGPADGNFQDIVAMLAHAMRSAIVDLPAETDAHRPFPGSRRVLCIELAPRDEAWIEAMFSHPQRSISAAH